MEKITQKLFRVDGEFKIVGKKKFAEKEYTRYFTTVDDDAPVATVWLENENFTATTKLINATERLKKLIKNFKKALKDGDVEAQRTIVFEAEALRNHADKIAVRGSKRPTITIIKDTEKNITYLDKNSAEMNAAYSNFYIELTKKIPQAQMTFWNTCKKILNDAGFEFRRWTYHK